MQNVRHLEIITKRYCSLCALTVYLICSRQLIEYLIKKWVYDHSTLLMDELQEEFSTYYIRPGADNKYGYNAFQGSYPNSIQHDHYYPEPIHIPKPQYPTSTFQNPGSGNTYIPPTFPQANVSNGFQGYPDRRQPLPTNVYNTYKYPNKSPEQLQQHRVYHSDVNIPPQGGEQMIPPYLNQNDLWNR